MGIKDIKTLINDMSEDKKITHFKNKKVLVDASIYLYKFIYRAPNIEDSTRYVVDGFLQQLKTFKKYNIVPIYIFDGAASQHKKVLEERSKHREKLYSKAENTRKEVLEMEQRLSVVSNNLDTLVDPLTLTLSQSICGEGESEDGISSDSENEVKNASENVDLTVPLGDVTDKNSMIQLLKNKQKELNSQIIEKRDSIIRLEKQTRKPNSDNVNTTMKVLDILGVPHVRSPVESDALCAYLIRNKKVDAVFTEDTDMLPLRCTSFVCGFDKERAILSEYHIEDILKNLEISYEQFVDLCILCGCDYAGKIAQIGPKRALPLLQKYGSIENIIEQYIKSDEKLTEKHVYEDTFLDEVKQARVMFYTAHNIEDYINTSKIDECLDFKWSIPSDADDELVNVLESVGMTQEARYRWLKAFKSDASVSASIDNDDNNNKAIKRPSVLDIFKVDKIA